MPDFSVDQNQQDPDAVRKALLAKLFGGQVPWGGTPPFLPSQTASNAAGSPGAAPAVAAAPTDGGTQPGPQPARPINGARPSNTSAAPGGMTRPASISDPEATNAATRPLPTFQSEEEWNKENPAPPHTPYVAPDLKHRLLMGLFAGMQEFGHPGLGAETARNYLGDIEKNEEAERNFPETSAAAQHQRYMTAVQGARAPLDLQELQARITDTQEQAKQRAADAAAKANPAPKMKPVKIADPTGQDPHGIPALQNQTTGEIIGEDGKVIAGAKLWEKPAAAPAGNDFERYYTKWLKDNKAEDTAANQLKAHKEWEIRPEQPGANDTRLDRSYQYNNNIVEKQRAPIDQRLERLDRVEQAINQKSAQADALIAPELLSVMVGGQGSGLRMTEAEIARIVGGRSKWADLQAVLQKWTPGSGLSVTPEQRTQISDLLKAVREKTEAKQRAYDDAQEALIHASTVDEHRKITADLKKKLSAIDSGEVRGKPGALPPGWKLADPNNPLGI